MKNLSNPDARHFPARLAALSRRRSGPWRQSNPTADSARCNAAGEKTNLVKTTKPTMKSKLKIILNNSAILLIIILIAGCASAGNNFDDSKISQIQKGQTTEADLVQMFGQPQNRATDSEGMTTLTWMYMQSTVRASTFIPYAGAFMGGTNSKDKTLNVVLADGKVKSYSMTGGGMDTRSMTQGVPNK